MKYNIYINQYAVISQGFDFDMLDMAIFDMIKDFANCTECVKINTPEGVFFWISAQKIMEDLPMLGIKTKNGVMKHVEKLCDAKVLVKHPNCQHYKMQLYQFGENYDRLLFSQSEKNSYPLPNIVDSDHQQKLPTTTNSSCSNNNINNYNIKNNNKENFIGYNKVKEQSLFDEDVQEKKESKSASHLFANSSIYKAVDIDNNDYSALYEMFNGNEYQDIDLAYYFHAILDWSDTSNTKRTDRGWKATFRTFIRKDIENGKLHRLKATATQEIDPDFVKFLNM